jgi:hypothetical protein
MTVSTTNAEARATFSHRTLTIRQWRDHLAKTEARGIRLRGGYHHIEYLSAPQGLIVLAHQNASHGQVDGIHPVSLSEYVDDDRNIIEPLVGRDSGYAVHYLNRKQQGSLVLGAFGRMIAAGAPEAPAFHVEKGEFVLEMFSTPMGPMVAAIENAKKVHLIEGDGIVKDGDLSAGTRNRTASNVVSLDSWRRSH